jgi:hypothetical protein
LVGLVWSEGRWTAASAAARAAARAVMRPSIALPPPFLCSSKHCRPGVHWRRSVDLG